MTTKTKKPNKFLNSLFSKQDINIFKYLFTTLIKNRAILAIAVINILIMIIIPIFLMTKNDVSMNENLHKYSWVYIGTPFILSIIYIAAGNMVLFIKTKNNNVDLFLFILPLNNLRILFIKYSAILLSSFYFIIVQFLVSVIQMIMGVTPESSLLFFLAISGSLILMNCIWIVIFSFISLNTKYLSALITVISTTFSFVVGFTLPIVAQNSFVSKNAFDSSQYKKNMVKVFSLDGTGKVLKTSYAIYENPLAKSSQKIKGWSPSVVSKYLPFSILTGFAGDALVNVANHGIKQNKLLGIDNKYSINHNEVATKPFNDVASYRNIVLSSIDEKSPFEYKDKITLFEDIKSHLMSDSKIASKINDEQFWKIFLNDLKNKGIWKTNISDTDKIIISHILGIDTAKSFLYTIFDKYDILYKRYLDGIHNFLASRTTKSFADLAIYLWSDQQSKLNVFSYKSLGGYEDVYKYHPSTSTYNSLKIANKYDIEYIKTILFNISDKKGKLKVQALGADGVYYNINNINNVFGPNVKTKQDVDSYIDSNSTINNLQNIIKKANANTNEEIEQMSFRNNVKNNFILREELSLIIHSKTPINLVYLLITILITFALQKQINYKISKGDVK